MMLKTDERVSCFRVVWESNPDFDTCVVERRVVAGGLSRSAAEELVCELDGETRASGTLAVHLVEPESGAGGRRL